MVLDIQLFRSDKGGNPDLVRESQKRRFKSVQIVDDIVELDNQAKKSQYTVTQIREQIGKLEKEINAKRKAGEDFKPTVEQKAKLEKSLIEHENEAKVSRNKVNDLLKNIGNIVHASVPVSDNEDDNEIVRIVGDLKFPSTLYHHHELLEMIDGYDPIRGSKVSGHRGYFLKGLGARLNMAIINYGLDFLEKRKYTTLQAPFLMRKDPMSKTAQLEQFDEELYKVVGGAHDEENEKYLIATSEQPISAYHQDEWLEEKNLPLKYAGISTCFRKEAGAAGRDVWGIFRVHQFEKVEQFVITTPESSWDMHEEMLKTAEEFYQSLKIPYRVVTIVSGALNNAAAKKYDLEGWFPAYENEKDRFRELVSASNCTDYQSRSLEIRCGTKKQGETEKRYVHMLNATLAATTRVISAILENYQTAEGVLVPEVLQPYLGGRTIIPYVKQYTKKK